MECTDNGIILISVTSTPLLHYSTTPIFHLGFALMFYPHCSPNIKGEAFRFQYSHKEQQKRLMESILDSYEGLE
jgi:hypothetical protein